MKNLAVTFSPFALDDIEQAVGYYNQLQPGLSKRFTQQLQQSLTAIKRNPFFASVRYDNIRCAQVKSFLTWYIIILMKNKGSLPSLLFTLLIKSLSGNQLLYL